MALLRLASTSPLIAAVGIAWFTLAIATPPAAAQQWQVQPVPLSEPVRELRQVGASVFVLTGGWLRLDL